MDPLWPLQDAKARFSALVDAALAGEAQVVTRRGRRAVVVIDADQYDRLRRSESRGAPGFIEHLMAIPKSPNADASGLGPTRRPLRPRDIDLT